MQLSDARPNVVLLMADDLGWGDLSFPVERGQGSADDTGVYPGTTLWETPNLAAMAQSGLLFTRMYAQSPTCSPTRASVLTGRAPERCGITFANEGRLERDEITLAEYALSLGYATGHFGKWHLGSLTWNSNDANRGRPGDQASYSPPWHHGFETVFSTESKVSTFNPGTSGLTVPTRYWVGPRRFVNQKRLVGDDSLLIARRVETFMRGAVEANRPFFVVVWFHAPHEPVNTEGNRNINDLAAYRGAVVGLDDAVGQIRSALRDLGVSENTLVFFTSDNGPEDTQDYNADGLRENKRELFEGGIRVPGMVEWPGTVAPGTTRTPMVTTDYLPTLLDLWGIAPFSDRPLDGQSMAEVLLRDRTASRTVPIRTRAPNGHRAILSADGRHKLISTDSGVRWSLYDLALDPGEQRPLAVSDGLAACDERTRNVFEQLRDSFEQWERSIIEERQANRPDAGIVASEGIVRTDATPMNLGLQARESEHPELLVEAMFAPSPRSVGLDRPVHSYLIHFDPPGVGGEAVVTLRFQHEIERVVDSKDGLSETDRLSFGDPVFDETSQRALEAEDRWSLSDDRKTLTVWLHALGDDLDEIRVLTRIGVD